MTNLTEDQAKEKWCPMARVLDTNDGTVCNRHYNYSSLPKDMNPTYSRCIGNQCMAWEWSDPITDNVEYWEVGRVPSGDGWVCTLSDQGRNEMKVKSRWERPNPNRNGHCCLMARSP